MRARCYNLFVRSRALHLIAALVLFTCLVCPLVEMFDDWDHTLQTGNDTEYTFVVLGLCIGASYTLVRAALGLIANSRSQRAGTAHGLLEACAVSSLGRIIKASLFASPPLTALRI